MPAWKILFFNRIDIVCPLYNRNAGKRKAYSNNHLIFIELQSKNTKKRSHVHLMWNSLLGAEGAGSLFSFGCQIKFNRYNYKHIEKKNCHMIKNQR